MLKTVIKIFLIIIISYLFGSLNFPIIISKIIKTDIRKIGSLNAGLTNIYRKFGKKKALLICILDILKILIIHIFSYIIFGEIGNIIAIFFVVIGHIHPIFFQLNGGKGVLLLSIWLLIFKTKIFIIMLLIFTIVFTKTKYVSLAVIINSIFLFTYILINNIFFNFYYCILLLINYILIMHLSNINRLLNENENHIFH